MTQNDFWKDKHLNDQYNKRNPGQENHPDSQRRSDKGSPPSPTPAAPQKERAPEKKR
jgi:hypothetical protein